MSPSLPRALALGLLLPLAGACERVDAPGSLMEPPARLTADATPTPAKAPALPAAVAVPRPAVPAALERLSILDPVRVGPAESFTVLTTLPQLTPPRAILRDVAGRELVVRPGDRVGEAGAVVTSVTATAITLTQLALDEATGIVALHDLRLVAVVPAPPPALPAEPAPVAPAAPATPGP